MESICEESKDYEMDNELKIDLSHEPASILHFEPIVTYLKHIENGLMVVSSKGCKKFETYILSYEIVKDLGLIEETEENNL